MNAAARTHFRDDLRLWAAAFATLAMLLQALLPGVGGFDAPGIASAHAAGMVHPAAEHHQGDRDATPECPLCAVCCTGVSAADAPGVPALPGPQADVALARRRRPAAPAGRKAAHRGTHSARGPPRLR